MSSGILDWIPKRTRDKAYKKAAKIARDVTPVAKTIQAVQGILQVGETANKVSSAADGLEKFIPAMQVMGKSLCDSTSLFMRFTTVASAAGIGANLVVTYQGVQALELIAARLQDISNSLAAQMALTAQREFPGYVYQMIRERLGGTAHDPSRDHWFFVYHPDNDWYPGFYHLVEREPLGPRFCGYTNQIDTAFVFMLAARQRLVEKKNKAMAAGSGSSSATRPVQFHLLIPAYQPILIAEKLAIPEEIGDFLIEGRINSVREFVWLNLPESQKHYTSDIGHWVPPPLGWWQWARQSMGIDSVPPKEHRVLGRSQHQLEPSPDEGDDDDEKSAITESGDADGKSVVLAKPKSNKQATPLHHRQKQSKKRHRQR